MDKNQKNNNKKFNNFLLGLGLLTILLYVIYIVLILQNKSTDNELPKKSIKVYDTVKLDSFNEDNLNTMMYLLEIKKPQIVFNQAKLETGHFTSNAFKYHNNLFGFMKGKKIRHYNNWKQSLIHYSHWKNVNYSGEDYYKFLIDIR